MTSHPDVLRKFAAATTRGLRRLRNEDTVAAGGALLTGEVTEPVQGSIGVGRAELFVVADGMGGHVHGARASREAVAEILADVPALADPEGCIGAVRRANLRLHDLMLRQPDTVGMGTTIAGVLLHGASICWFNVGDSRIYRVRPAGRLEQLSVDDTAEPAASRRASHTLSQSLGGQRAISPIRPHAGRAVTMEGERLLLCSDGLTDMLPDTTIAAVLASRREVAAAVKDLLGAALEAGGRDNVSILLVQ